MQATIDETIETIVLSDLGKAASAAPDAGEDFGFYYPPDYVLDTWLKYRQHGTLPEAGAYNDQDPLLVDHDWNVLNRRYNYHMAQHTDEKDGSAIPLPETAPDWNTLL